MDQTQKRAAVLVLIIAVGLAGLYLATDRGPNVASGPSKRRTLDPPRESGPPAMPTEVKDTGRPNEALEVETRNRLLDDLHADMEALMEGRHVRCPVPGVPPETAGSFLSGLVEHPVGVRNSGGLMLVTSEDSGEGILALSGYAETPMSWRSDEAGQRLCEVGPLTPVQASTLSGVVLDASGEPAPGAELRGCGLYLNSDSQGQFRAERPYRRPCILQAVGGRLDGALAEVFVPGTDGDIEVELQAAEVAMMGIVAWSRPGQDYWEVPEVLPNSPAADAGIESGDEIVAVDGEDVAGHSPAEWLLGPIGRRIELSFSDGTTATVELENAAQIYRDAGLSEDLVRGILESRSMGWSY